MTSLEKIYKTAESQPEGRELLTRIKLNINSVPAYRYCNGFNNTIIPKLEENGISFSDEKAVYSIQEIIDATGDSLISGMVHIVLLNKLNEFIKNNRKY